MAFKNLTDVARDSEENARENLLAEEEGHIPKHEIERPKLKQRLFKFAFGALLLISYTLVVMEVSGWPQPTKEKNHEKLSFYSPASESSFEEIRMFSHGVDHKYFGPPTDERNAAWENICGDGNGILQLKLTEQEKNLLPSSLPVPDMPDHQIYALNMCHQLHCLNRIRLSFHEGYFADESEELRTFHKDHCIDHIRDNIMCKADISLDFWEFDKSQNSSFLRMHHTHQCKNWEKIIEWSSVHKLDQGRLPL